MSNHSLLIEKGRHLKLERSERKCPFCKIEIEDEQHFLTKCPAYTAERTHLEKVANSSCKNFSALNENQKFIYLMSNDDYVVIKSLAKFIFESFDKREKLLMKT